MDISDAPSMVAASYRCFGIESKKPFSKNIRYPFGRTHINIKSMFAMFMGLEKPVAFSQAIDIVGTKFDGIPHRAGDDAYNIANVLKGLILTFRS